MADDTTPWRDEQRLRELYVEKDLTQQEIADQMGCDKKTISNWLDKYDIDTGFSFVREMSRDWLYEQYVEKKRSVNEIADGVGCSTATVLRRLDEHDIETRPSSREKPLHFETRANGYERVQTAAGGERAEIGVHRLVAIAEHGVDAVAGNHVHHKNTHRYDNRPQNLMVVGGSEHNQIHSQEKSWTNYPEAI